MARWEGGADERLTQAAYKLYLERGFDDVTIAEIAECAGLTKRTFFRYFADKREVLFSGAAAFQESVVRSVMEAPDGVTAIEAVIRALSTVGTGITDIGEPARQRQRLIETSTDLQEREMIKMTALTLAIGATLEKRNVSPLASRLTAQVGVAVFTTAFERWAADEGPAEFSLLVDEALREVQAAISAVPGAHTVGPPRSAAVEGLVRIDAGST